MRIKRISAFLCAMLIMASVLASAVAAEPKGETIDLGDGYYVVRTVTQPAMTWGGDMVYGNVTNEIYNGSTQIGAATLYASFDISGSTAMAKTASVSGTGMNGWTYSNGTARCSGNAAYGTAIFKSGSTQKQFNLSISCSPNGELS